MTLTPLDWIVVALTLAVSFLPALFFARRGGSSLAEFFVSGRSLPWWLSGFSMVATTFSTGTPTSSRVSSGGAAWRATGSGGPSR